MSASKGNVRRNRPQKHQNRTAFRNDLHDTSKKTKSLNALQVSGVCTRCKEIIEWKIKYKKYKPLAAPRKCVGCDQKTVRQAYHIFCNKCSTEKRVCAKCCKSSEETSIVPEIQQEQPAQDKDLQAMMKNLPERKRRTILRYLKKQEGEQTPLQIEKLMSDMLKLDDDDFFDDLLSDECSDVTD
ncbi:unnamed protein product [Leptosia nina]|uniref:Uncharacterized protein n=1 Tax=Leptosia nina TaxID=320188 RepID=A0AAV1JHY9_9NEOP